MAAAKTPLLPMTGAGSGRRRFDATSRRSGPTSASKEAFVHRTSKEAFVHRSVQAGHDDGGDFGESWSPVGDAHNSPWRNPASHRDGRGGQGVRREHIGQMRPTNNAVQPGCSVRRMQRGISPRADNSSMFQESARRVDHLPSGG